MLIRFNSRLTRMWRFCWLIRTQWLVLIWPNYESKYPVQNWLFSFYRMQNKTFSFGNWSELYIEEKRRWLPLFRFQFQGWSRHHRRQLEVWMNGRVLLLSNSYWHNSRAIHHRVWIIKLSCGWKKDGPRQRQEVMIQTF